MDKYKTLTIFDWDDTIFPTFWTIQNSININDKNAQNQYIIFFSKLDMLLYRILTTLLKYGNVAIITNAGAKWIMASSVMLPNSQKIIKNNVIVISARDVYQKKYPNDMSIWKKKVFQNVIIEQFNNVNMQNIISIGDADYEFFALIDLYDKLSFQKKKLLKTIRFKREPSFDDIIEQLEILDKSIVNIVKANKHLDLKIENK